MPRMLLGGLALALIASAWVLSPVAAALSTAAPVEPPSCHERLAKILAVLEGEAARALPMQVTGGGFHYKECKPSVGVAGFVSQAEIEKLTAGTGVEANVYIQPPPDLQPVPVLSLSTWLRPEPPARAEARSGETLMLGLPIRNLTGQTLNGMWGDSSYDYEVLDAAGKPVAYRAKSGVNFAVGYPFRCHAGGNCTPEFRVSIPLNYMNPHLPLPSGEYTIRLALKEFMVDGPVRDLTMHDLGVIDIPLTITP